MKKNLAKPELGPKLDDGYEVWWKDEGSGQRPASDEDWEEFVNRMTKIAWLNGAYIANENNKKIKERNKNGNV